MAGLYPILFHPRFKARVWGGRTLETLYGKALPPEVPIGESWEISDRPGDESVVANGAYAGRTLRWLMEQHGAAVLGDARPAAGGRFPLLCKILDAREKLSLQVHPPPRAAHLGDPKTEMWFIAQAEPGAELFVGLRRGVTRDGFERAIRSGGVASCFHRIAVQSGDTMFLPSGRVHAIGAGLVIFEIQQNSDTTFRVYDWDRLGLDGKPRDLHVEESLESIDFSDFEPSLVGSATTRSGGMAMRPLVRDALFDADLVIAEADGVMRFAPGLRVIAGVEGETRVRGGNTEEALRPGQFCLVPAAVTNATVSVERGARFVVVQAGRA